MGFPRQEYWNGLPCPPPGDLRDAGIKATSLMSSAFAGRFFMTSTTWEARVVVQSLSCVQFFVTPWNVAFQASLSFALAGRLFITESPGKSPHILNNYKKKIKGLPKQTIFWIINLLKPNIYVDKFRFQLKQFNNRCYNSNYYAKLGSIERRNTGQLPSNSINISTLPIP